MRSRMLVGGLLLVSALGAVTVATHGDGVSPARQSAVVYLAEPTLIGSTIVQGPVLFTHDNTKMKRGEPCTTVRLFEPGLGTRTLTEYSNMTRGTTVRLFEPGLGPAEEIAAFHCIPIPRKVVGKFTIRTRSNTAIGFGCVLTEYQFAGDAEGHGVPIPANAH